MDVIILKVQQNFESIRQVNNDMEFWSARDLMPLLGYVKRQKFLEVIGRAKGACKALGQNPDDWITGSGKPIVI